MENWAVCDGAHACVRCSPFLVDPEEDPHVFHQFHRFDLSRIPEGEAVTASEFRVYKDFVHAHHENETFHVSVYQVLREYDDR